MCILCAISLMVALVTTLLVPLTVRCFQRWYARTTMPFWLQYSSTFSCRQNRSNSTCSSLHASHQHQFLDINKQYQTTMSTAIKEASLPYSQQEGPERGLDAPRRTCKFKESMNYKLQTCWSRDSKCRTTSCSSTLFHQRSPRNPTPASIQ